MMKAKTNLFILLTPTVHFGLLLFPARIDNASEIRMSYVT
ncbi:MAG: hypothetical protein QOF93_507 [Verrucomicrobiota bacterium]